MRSIRRRRWCLVRAVGWVGRSTGDDLGGWRICRMSCLGRKRIISKIGRTRTRRARVALNRVSRILFLGVVKNLPMGILWTTRPSRIRSACWWIIPDLGLEWALALSIITGLRARSIQQLLGWTRTTTGSIRTRTRARTTTYEICRRGSIIGKLLKAS